MTEISFVPAFSDNYIWILKTREYAVVVDPGDAKPVLQYLKKRQLELYAILITHHHRDHVGGVDELMAAFPKAKLFDNHTYREAKQRNTGNNQTTIQLGPLQLSLGLIATPGHTLDHICYYNDEILFCGDTLFSIGCGRLFEGTAQQMFASLKQLKALPDHTKVYCTHEYTEANLKFALSLQPDNQELLDYAEKVKKWREQGIPSLPSSIGLEKQLNPFLNCQTADEFAELRRLKDGF